MKRYIHVMAGVIENPAGEILIARRADKAHQGGLWEFPGGKLEPGETPEQALARELDEELGIQVRQCRPQIRIHHDYGDKQVFLDVWRVTAFSGQPHGREGQPVRWVRPEALGEFAFPLANRPIVTAAQLPAHYLITPEPTAIGPWLAQLEAALEKGVRLVQLRAKSLDEAGLRELSREVVRRCRAWGASWLLNGQPELARACGADGVHLPERELGTMSVRPEGLRWVAASCHGPDSLRQARERGCDFAVLSPVQATLTHPDSAALGWERFGHWVENAGLPVYALGGLQRDDTSLSWRHGAQGIAAMRGLWA